MKPDGTKDSVLFISLNNYAAWGGSEELWYQTALYAARQGYNVGCACYEWPQNQHRVASLKEAGCTLYLFSNKGRSRKTVLDRLQFKITKRRVKAYARSLPLRQYNYTVVSLGYLEIISPYWKDFYRFINRYTLLFHVHKEGEELKPGPKKRIAEWVQQARHNLFASDRTRVYLEKQLGRTIPNSGILLNPLTFMAPAEITPFPPLMDNTYVFVMLATLDTRRKAQDNLIIALSAAKWQNRNWRLYLYGGGEDGPALQNLITEKEVSNKIFLKGHTTNVKAALAEAHLLLQMTHVDAMPLSVVEAMAMAKPVAVSDVGDMPEWVVDNVNGWVSADASVASIDETLERSWQNRARWGAMGKESFRLFKNRFPPVPEAYLLQQIT